MSQPPAARREAALPPVNATARFYHRKVKSVCSATLHTSCGFSVFFNLLQTVPFPVPARPVIEKYSSGLISEEVQNLLSCQSLTSLTVILQINMSLAIPKHDQH